MKELVWSAYTIGVGIGAAIFSPLSDRSHKQALYYKYMQMGSSTNVFTMRRIVYCCIEFVINFDKLLRLHNFSSAHWCDRLWMLFNNFHRLYVNAVFIAN
jgi:hypothetical protein